MSELDVDPMFMVGYSVAIQYLPPEATPMQLFKNSHHHGIVFKHSPNVSTFTFSIHDGQFEVIGIETIDEKDWKEK